MFKQTKLVVTVEEGPELKPDGFIEDLLGIYEAFLTTTEKSNFITFLYVGEEIQNGAKVDHFKKVLFLGQKTEFGSDLDIYHDFWIGDVYLNKTKLGFSHYLCELEDDTNDKEDLAYLVEMFPNAPYYHYKTLRELGYVYINQTDNDYLINLCGFPIYA